MTGAKSEHSFSADVESGAQVKRKKKLTGRWFCFLGLLILLAALYVQLLLPFLAENAVAKSFAQALGSDVEADIRVSPPWRLFNDSIEGLSISITSNGESIPVSSLRAQWQNSDTLLTAIRFGEAGLRENGPEHLTYIWDDRTFRQFLNEKQNFLSDIVVVIDGDTVLVNAKTELYGEEKQLELTLKPRIDENGELVLEAESITGLVSDITVREKITDALTFGLQLLPFEWQITALEVIIDNNEIIVTATGI